MKRQCTASCFLVPRVRRRCKITTRLYNVNCVSSGSTLSIKSIQNPSDHFNIQTFIKFCHHSTRSSSSNKLEHVFTSSNQQKNFYFNRLPRTFNSLPVIDLTQPFVTIKFQLTKILWQHFTRNFDPDNQHSFHFTCPCSICSKHPKPPNFNAFSS